MLHTKKGISAMIQRSTASEFLKMSFFSKNQSFYSTHPESLPSSTHMPYFPDDVSPPIMVYERRRHKDVPQLPPPPNPSAAPDLATATSPDAAAPSS